MLEHLYLNYHRQLQEGQRQLVRQVLEHPPGLFHGTPPVRYEMFDIPEGDISFVRIGNDRFALHALGNGVSLTAQAKALIWPFGGSGASFAASLEVLDCAGSRQEILDYCLLHFRDRGTNAAWADSMKKVVGLVLGAEPRGAYRQWLETRLTEGAYSDETQWLLSCLSSDNPSLVAEALALARQSQDPRVRQAVCEIITKRQMRPDVRAQAISIAARPGDKAALLSLVAVLPEQELVSKREYCAQFAPDYPLSESLTYQTLRPLLEHTFAQPAQTLGQAAMAALKKATRQDFGPDPEKWRDFVNKSR